MGTGRSIDARFPYSSAAGVSFVVDDSEHAHWKHRNFLEIMYRIRLQWQFWAGKHEYLQIIAL